jgi:hypothetical protein
MIPSTEFLIVGTPRSGTTLVQRLASEHPDCSVPPETHFFVHFYPHLIRSGVTFPLDNRALKKCLDEYIKMPTSAGLALEPDQLLHDNPSAGARPLTLFAAIVRHLAEPAKCVGEKTPDHLLWWRPLSRGDNRLRFIWVVRDPRAVVASSLKVPWGMNSARLLAQRWRLDIGSLQRAREALGQRRLLVVRYEDVVQDSERERASIWQFLDLPVDVAPRHADDSMLRSPREKWKDLAAGPIVDRANLWQEELPTETVGLIESICRQQMADFGYQTRAERPSGAPRNDMIKAAYHRFHRIRKQAWIDRQEV